MSERLKKWIWSLLLPVPLYVVYLCHFLGNGPDHLATGLIQLDSPLYLSKIREIYDTGHLLLAFSNPCSPYGDAPPVYFQIQILVLGLISFLTHLAPSHIFVTFHLACAVLMARSAIALFEEAVGLKTGLQWLGMFLFFWGGGLICLAGIAHGMYGLHDLRSVLFNAFEFDPGAGWWFMNLGRNITLPLEAYYHILFLLAIVALLRGHHRMVLLLAALTCLSHVVTGFQLLAVVLAWTAFERWFMGNGTLPRYLFPAASAMLMLHVGYYVLFLNRFPEHHAVAKQVTVEWLIDAKHFIPAYALVGLFAVWQFRSLPLARRFFSRASNRFFLIMALVSFILENHEFAIPPVQPAHFTRGYCWLALFLLGAPTLLSLLGWVRNRFAVPSRSIVVLSLAGLFCLDNLLWYPALCYERLVIRKNKGDFYLTGSQADILDALATDKRSEGALAITTDPLLGYMIPAYTPLRSWASHWYETPDYKLHAQQMERFFTDGTIMDDWTQHPTIVIAPSTNRVIRTTKWIAGGSVIHTNAAFTVYLVPAGR